MSGVLRRIGALLLGVIVGIAGGAFWTYQNIKPIKMLEEQGVIEKTDSALSDANIEELVELIVRATKNPDDYSFARLEKEYGLDLKKILEQAGINTDNASEEDMNALKNVSLLSLINGAEAFLDNIKLRALYVILPSVMNKDLDEILSKEAQAQLGDYTLWQLLNSDEETDELGLVTALKSLKVGALLPSVFDTVYNADKHEYTYSVKEGSNLQILNLVADVPLKAILDLANGVDPVKSLMEGDLKVLGDKPLTEILSTIFSVAGKDVQSKLDRFTRVLGDSKLSDLFKFDGDKYVLTFENVLSEIDFGYIFGFEKDENGIWYKDQAMTQPIDGLLEMLANLDLKALSEADGDVIAAIEAVIGDMSIQTIYETFVDDNKIPMFVQALGDLTVSDILRNGTKEILPTIIENLNLYIGDWTLGQALNDILKPAEKQKVENSAFLSGLMNLRFGDFLKEKYTVDTFIDGFDNAMGDIELGALFGKEKVDGKWQGVNNLVGIMCNITLGDIFDVIRADNFTEAVQALFGSITIGDFYGAIFDFTITDEDPVYHKNGRYVTEGFNEFLNLEFWKLLVKFDKNSTYDIMNDVRNLTVGDIVYSTLVTFRNVDKYLSNENGEVALTGALSNYAGFSKVFLNETLATYKANKTNGDWWVDKFVEAYKTLTTRDQYIVLGAVGAAGVVLYYVDNPLLVKIVTKLFGEDAIWYDVVGKVLDYEYVDGRYIGGRFYNSFMDNAMAANVVETVTKGYPFLSKFKYYMTFGNMLTLTEKIANKVEKTIGKEFIVSDDGTPTFSGSLINFADIVFDIPLSSVIQKIDGKVTIVIPDEINDLMVGDIFAFFMNRRTNTNFNAWLSSDRTTWTVKSDKLETIYTNLFNLTIGQIRKDKAKVLKDLLGDTMLYELVNAYDTSWQGDCFLTVLYNVRAVDFIDLLAGQALLKDVYGTVTLRDALGGYFTESQLSDTVVSATMDLTVGEIADMFSAQSKRIALKEIVFNLYRDLYFRDFFNTAAKFANMDMDSFINKLPTGKKFIDKVLDYQIGYFEVSTKAQIKEALNNLYLGDLVVELAEKVTTKFTYITHNIIENEDGTYTVYGDFAVLTNKLYNLSFGDMYRMLQDMTEIKEYIFGFKVGDFTSDIARKGYNYTMKQLGSARRHTVSYVNGEYVASGDFALLANRVYNLSVEKVYNMLKDKNLIKEFIAEFKVGDFIAEAAPAFYNRFLKNFNRTHNVSYVNGEYVASGDFALLANRVYNLNILDALKMLKTPANLKAFVGEFKLGDFTADAAPVIYRKFMSRFGATHNVSYVNGEYVVTGDFEALGEKFYNLTVLDAYDMFMNESKLRSFVGDLKVGDFTASLGNVIIDKFMAKYDRQHVATYVNGEYVVEGAMAEFFADVYNLTGRDIIDLYRNPFNVFVKFNRPLGVYAKYAVAVLKRFDSNTFDTTIVVKADGTYEARGNYAFILNTALNVELKDFIDNLRAGKLGYIKNEILGNVRVGNVFRKGTLVYNDETKTWFDKDGNELDFGSTTKNVMMNKVYSMRIVDLQGFDVDKLLEGIYVGDISGYICDNDAPGHEHDENCVWLGLQKVYSVNDLTNLIEVYMPLDAQERVVAEMSLVDLINNGIHIKEMLTETKLGELLGLYFDGEYWYEYETVNGYRVIDDNNNYIIGKMSSELHQAICGIDTTELLSGNGVDAIISSIHGVRIGYVLGYTYNETLNKWVSNGTVVEGAMAKMADYTIDYVKNNFSHILSDEFTFADLLDEDTLNGNVIFKNLASSTLSSAANDLHSMKLGTLMGYEERGSYWYRNGERVDDEILDILADYCYGQFANVSGYELYDDNGNVVSFMTHLVNNMSKNLSIGVLYPDAGTADADGFNALLDPTWKIGELSEKLMNKLHTEATVEQLIKLEVFGEYFAITDGKDVATTATENFVMMDNVFAKILKVDAGEARAVWSQMTMPEFMTNLMAFVTRIENAGTVRDFIELGMFEDFFDTTDGKDLDTTMSANFVMMDNLYSMLNPEIENVREYWLGLTMPEFMGTFGSIVDRLEQLEWYKQTYGG